MPKVILFAGPIGSSKTPIANYLSYNLNLPVFNRDAIRTEVKEDLGEYDVEEFEKRSIKRLKEVFEKKIDFILDASVDRKLDKYIEYLEEYDYFIISINISKEFLKKLYLYKKYEDSLKRIDQNYQEHLDFLRDHSKKIGLNINDKNFNNRLDIALEVVKDWYGV